MEGNKEKVQKDLNYTMTIVCILWALAAVMYWIL